MLSRNRNIALALTAALSLAACGDSNNGIGIGTGGTSNVQFVNATNSAIDFSNNGAVSAGNGGVGFAGTSTCLQVDPNAANLGARQTASGTPLNGFSTSSFVGGGSYLIVAYPAAGGGTAFATLSNSYAAGSNQGGLRVFNAVPGTTFDVYVNAPGATTGTANAVGITFANSSGFFPVASGAQQVRITNSGSATVAASVASQSFTSGQNQVLVIAPAAAGTTTLRTFFVTGC